MESYDIMSAVACARLVNERIAQLLDDWKDKTPTPGAPVDDYIVSFSPVFFKDNCKAVALSTGMKCSRVIRLAAAGMKSFYCPAPGGPYDENEHGNESPSGGFKTLIIDDDYMADLRKKGTTNKNKYLVHTIEGCVDTLAGKLFEKALIKTLGNGQAAVGYKDEHGIACLLATLLRILDAEIQGRPNNVPDIVVTLDRVREPINDAMRELSTYIHISINNPKLDTDPYINESADDVVTSVGIATMLLEYCGGISMDKETLRAIPDRIAPYMAFCVHKDGNYTPIISVCDTVADRECVGHAKAEKNAVIQAARNAQEKIQKSKDMTGPAKVADIVGILDYNEIIPAEQGEARKKRIDIASGEIRKLARAAQRIDADAELKTLKDNCSKVYKTCDDAFTQIISAAEYLDAVKSRL